jgi:hypothetical protein
MFRIQKWILNDVINIKRSYIIKSKFPVFIIFIILLLFWVVLMDYHVSFLIPRNHTYHQSTWYYQATTIIPVIGVSSMTTKSRAMQNNNYIRRYGMLFSISVELSRGSSHNICFRSWIYVVKSCHYCVSYCELYSLI